MGAGGSSIDPDEFATLKKQVASLNSSVSSLNTLKTQVDSLASAAAKQISYSDLALSITNNDTNKNALATAIASNPNKLGDALASSIGTNNTVIQSLQDKLGTNTTFQKAMADTLSSDPYKIKFAGPKGADGNIGDAGALKSNLFDQARTMWCAEGELCKVPAGKKGIDWGYGASKIVDDGQLRIISDDNIFLRVGDKSQKGVHVTQAGVGGVVIGDEEQGNFTGLNIKRRDGRYTHFDWKDDQRNYIRGDTVFDGNKTINGSTRSNGNIILNDNGLSARGFIGPFRLKLYDKNTCMDSGQFDGNGDMGCGDNNPYQQFYYSPVTGQLRNVQNGKCLDVGNNKWYWENCSNHQNQQFWRKEHLLQWKNGDCVDLGNGNHHAGCDGNNNNQKIAWEYIGQ